MGNAFSHKIRLTMSAMIVAISFMAATAGCALIPAGTTAPAASEAAATGAEKPKIKFSYKKGKISSNLEKVINEAYIKGGNLPPIEIITIPDEKYDETLNMLFTSGEAPDVFEASYQWIDGYITKNWVLSLKSYCSDEFLDRFPGWTGLYMPNGNIPGEIYSLPSSQTTLRLIYNRDLFRLAGLDAGSPPKTMDELKYYAGKIARINEGYKKYGFALNAGDGRKCFEQLMEDANTFSGVYVYDFKEGRYDLPVYNKWLSAIREMKENESLFPGEAILKEDNALAQFMEGNIGMMYATSTAPRDLQYLAQKTGKKCDWGVALPPSLDAGSFGKGRVSVIPSAFYCVNSRSLNIDEAIEFWKYLYSKDCQGQMFKYGDLIPVTGDIIDNPDYTPEVEKLTDFLPSSHDSVHPVIPKVIDDWPRFDSYFAAVNGTKPIEEILQTQNDDLNFEYNMVLDSGLVDYNDYKDPGFDWLDPLK